VEMSGMLVQAALSVVVAMTLFGCTREVDCDATYAQFLVCKARINACCTSNCEDGSSGTPVFDDECRCKIDTGNCEKTCRDMSNPCFNPSAGGLDNPDMAAFYLIQAEAWKVIKNDCGREVATSENMTKWGRANPPVTPSSIAKMIV